MWRRIYKFFLWLIISSISLVLIMALVVYLMRDEIKKYAVDYINTYLKSELHVSDIDVTFISTFPKATVCLIDPYMLDPDSMAAKKDTLFSARKVFFEFDVWDIFYGKYDIESIRGEKLYTRLYIDTNGRENFDIIKPTEERKEEPEEFDLNLKSIKADHLRFVYRNDFLDQEYAVNGIEPEVTGVFKGEKLAFTCNTKLKVKRIKKEKINLVNNQSGELKIKVNLDKTKDEITFPAGDLKLGKMELGITGTVLNPKEKTTIDLSITGKKVPVVSILSLMPETVRKKSDQYESRGLVDALLTVKGDVGNTTAPLIAAEFSINKGSITEKESGISLHTIDLKGNYTNRNKDGNDELYLKQFDARMRDGSFSMKYRMKDFTTPRIDLTLESDLKLETIQEFMSPAYIHSMNGSVKTSWALACTITNPDDITTRTVEIHKASGTISFADASLKLRDMYQKFSELNGTFTVNKTDALIEDVSGKAGSSDFHLNGAIQNLTSYILTGNTVMNIVGDIQSNNTDLNDLIPREEEKQSEVADQNKKHPYQFHFPNMFNLNVDVNVGNLAWNKFKAKNVSGNVLMVKDRLDIRDLETTTAGGRCTGQLSMADIGNNRFKITSQSHYEKVNMDEVMRVFNEFGQKMITSENIKGEVTADMDMAAEMDGALTIDYKKLLARVNVHITGGELAHVTTLKNISTYMRKDPKARLILKKHAATFEKRLDVIRFSDLENIIEIKDEKVTIPRMVVKSSALDLSLHGTHTFSNLVDYHFSFRFKDLKENVAENEFGIIKDDGTGLHVYLRMFGDINNPSYEIDKEQMKEDFKVKLTEEKQTVKSLLKDEFGFFKKDSTLKAQTKQHDDDVEFIIEWDNASGKKEEEITTTSEEKKDKGRKKLNILKKKVGIEEKKNEVEIEIEDNP